MPESRDPQSRGPGPVWEFEASSLSWVFARDISGRETEATLKPGDRIQVRGRLTYLAIGDAAAISVRIDGTERDLSSLPRAGRAVRLRGPELDALR